MSPNHNLIQSLRMFLGYDCSAVSLDVFSGLAEKVASGRYMFKFFIETLRKQWINTVGYT